MKKSRIAALIAAAALSVSSCAFAYDLNKPISEWTDEEKAEYYNEVINPSVDHIDGMMHGITYHDDVSVPIENIWGDDLNGRSESKLMSIQNRLLDELGLLEAAKHFYEPVENNGIYVVPKGLWQFGKDIPAGQYTLTAPQGGYTVFLFGDSPDESTGDYICDNYSPLIAIHPHTSADLNAQKGKYLYIREMVGLLTKTK